MTKAAFDPEKSIEEILNLESEEVQPNAETIGEKPGVSGQRTTEFNFDIIPEELESFLNQYVVGQEQTIEVIATKVCTHFNRMKLDSKINQKDARRQHQEQHAFISRRAPGRPTSSSSLPRR